MARLVPRCALSLPRPSASFRALPRLWLVVAALALPPSGRAQTVSRLPAPEVRREIPGFDFRPDGVWRRQARAVRANRARLLARGNFPALNAPLAPAAGAPVSRGTPLASPAAVSGVLGVPAIVFKFRDTPAALLRDTTQFNQVLFAAAPTGASAGRPYTYRSFYEQMSNGLLSVEGASYGYAALDSNEVTYTGVPGTCGGNPYGTSDCNGLFSADAYRRMQNGLREALGKLDSQVDWTQYDNNGDGYVDLVAFIQPALDGACGPAGNNHVWPHRGYLADIYGQPAPYPTHSVNSLNVRIKVADYIVESGVGGEGGCDTTQIMPIGVVAHETGHGLGLPDLYDTRGTSAGIGEWGLMGSGNWTSPLSPSRMEAWSLHELGWVTVVPLPWAGTYGLGAAPASDTAFYLRALGSDPRGEYFLLENRQPMQSDSAMIHHHCRVWYNHSNPPGSCGGGLLIWRVDSAQVASGRRDNVVNSGPIHGVALVQADAFSNLEADTTNLCWAAPAPGCSNRGDAGDLYPGTTGNIAFTATSTPAALRKADGQPAGFALDQITQVVPNETMSFRLAYPVWVVRAEVDTAAVIHFDGVTHHVFRGILSPGSTHTVSVDSAQFTAAGRTEQVFVSWNIGAGDAGGAGGKGARSFQYTAGASPETLTVTLARLHRLAYMASGGGTVAADTAGTPVASGAFLPQGRPVTLTASEGDVGGGGDGGGGAGSGPFVSWEGDTVSKSATITLPMGRPYDVRATFLAPLSTAAVVSQLFTGTGLTAQDTVDLDRLGNGNGRFDVGDFLAWVNATGAPLTAEQRGRADARRTKGASR